MRNLFFITITVAALIGLAGTAPVVAKAPETKVPASAKKITVRTNVEVNRHLIKLDDLFTNTGDKAEIEVAYAPEPGKRAVFDARWLYRVARAYQLPWRPLSNRIRTIVTRQSDVIERREVEEILLGALLGKGADPNSEMELSNRTLRLHVPGGALGDVDVQEINYSDRTRRFSAMIASPAGNGTIKLTRVRGRLFTTREVPVLNRRVLAGEVIKNEDLKWIKVRTSRLQTNVVMSETDIVGRTPRRGLRAGYPILTSTVQRPILVPKGSLVTVVLRTPQMLLTAQGKALESGAEGDVVKINNSQSDTVIEAEVIAAGRVAVRSSTLLAMN